MKRTDSLRQPFHKTTREFPQACLPQHESHLGLLPCFPSTSHPHPHQLGQPLVNQYRSCSYSSDSSHGLLDLWTNSRSKIDTASLSSAFPGGTQLQGYLGLCTASLGLQSAHPAFRADRQVFLSRWHAASDGLQSEQKVMLSSSPYGQR